MPFKSQAQKSYLYIHHPEIAKRWSREFPNQGKLPKHVKKKIPTNKKEMIEYQHNKKGFMGKTIDRLRSSFNSKVNRGIDEAAKRDKPHPLKLKKKYKIGVNNKLKGALGQMDPDTNEIEINVKKHKGDRAELASTIKHELMHVKHPKMTEREVYKKTAKTKISPMEQTQLISKLRNKKLHYKQGSLKRKFKMDRNEKVEPGTFLTKYNGSKKQIAIRGLI